MGSLIIFSSPSMPEWKQSIRASFIGPGFLPFPMHLNYKYPIAFFMTSY